MATRTEDLAANGRANPARLRIRDLAAILAVVFAGVGAMSAGMQWAVSTSLAPLFLEVQALRSDVTSIREDVDVLRSEVAVLRSDVDGLRSEVGKLRTEVEENRRQIADLRERVAKVEVGLTQVQANQARILELLDRERRPRE